MYVCTFVQDMFNVGIYGALHVSWCFYDGWMGLASAGGIQYTYTIDNLLKAAHRKLAHSALYHPVKTGCNASMYIHSYIHSYIHTTYKYKLIPLCDSFFTFLDLSTEGLDPKSNNNVSLIFLNHVSPMPFFLLLFVHLFLFSFLII